MPLTDTSIRALKPGPKMRKVSDALGLYLEITAAGQRWWRWKYRFGGKEKRLALGVYPDVSLKQARQGRDDARQLLARGVDPGAERKKARLLVAQRQADTFEGIALEWIGKQEPTWSDTHAETIRQRLRDYIFTPLGRQPIAEITAPELLAVIRKVEQRSLEVAHRTLRICGQVFRYGIATGRCSRDPAADLKGSLPPFHNKNFAATLEPRKLGHILRHMDSYGGSPAVRAALKLAPLLFVRPGELRRAEWSTVDLEAAEWRFIGSKARKTDVKIERIVPLARQVVEVLEWLKPITGDGRYVFPSGRGGGRPMSENAILVAMRSLGIGSDEMTGHGFRAVARTLLDEELHFPPHIIEHQLSHTVRDPLGRAYNRTSHLPERRRMMQAWADHLDALKNRSGMVVMQRA